MMQFYIYGKPRDGTFPELGIITVSAEEAFKNSGSETISCAASFCNSFYIKVPRKQRRRLKKVFTSRRLKKLSILCGARLDTNNWRKMHGKPMVRRVKIGGKYV